MGIEDNWEKVEGEAIQSSQLTLVKYFWGQRFVLHWACRRKGKVQKVSGRCCIKTGRHIRRSDAVIGRGNTSRIRCSKPGTGKERPSLAITRYAINYGIVSVYLVPLSEFSFFVPCFGPRPPHILRYA